MQQEDLIYALLDMFETTVPGVSIEDVTVPGYSKEEVRQAVVRMRAERLIDMVVARDVTGAPYSGCVIGLAPRGGFLQIASSKSRRPMAIVKDG
jgi:hypothetical protein